MIDPRRIFRRIRRMSAPVVHGFRWLGLRIRRLFPSRHDWDLAVCSIFKNEAPYFAEWLEFHELSGVQHFFLYDDGSTDDFMPILQPWIDRGLVTVRKAGHRRQVAVYNHCLRHGARRARWVAFIDLDEFLFNPSGEELPSVLEKYSGCSGVFVHWILFGSNGHVRPPAEGVLRSYTKSMSIESAIRDDFDHEPRGTSDGGTSSRARNGKSIVDPRAVVVAGVHSPHRLAWGHLVDENLRRRSGGPNALGEEFSCDVLRINHYWSRSLEELEMKIARGRASVNVGIKYNLERSLEREKLLNEIEDDVILSAEAKLRARQKQGN